MRVAALFVDPAGPYAEIDGVDLWDAERDARFYDGVLPVVAHPPCKTWGNLWWATGKERGDDDGMAAAAVASILRRGGVLEHPQGSYLWRTFGLPRPIAPEGVWCKDLVADGWSTWADQGRWGHACQKRTWFWFYSPTGEEPEDLDLPPSLAPYKKFESLWSTDPRRWLTPPALADVLVRLALTATKDNERG